MRLLLIEDEEVLGRVTAQALGKASFTVDWVKNGLDAVAAVQGHEYDAILLDLGLPDMTGEEFVKDLRSKRHATPVIVLTARGQVEDRVTVLDLGADDYLVKPFNMSELCARLRAVKRRTSSGVGYTDSQEIGPLGDEVESNAIEVYIHFLRRKFSPGLVVTVRGKGYQLGSEESLAAEAARLKPPES